ncbi:subunit 17 of mediator complex-domain-containing protein [Phaeosphaeriaceae sp. PMI808]|nr:subunit 17 of mediator complex-domain-containing protein [Phaeosphaeriaceae sp. PMI808]
MSKAESLRDVTLRPWPTPKKEELGPQDLLLQIEQLTTERGHLRNITEKSLQEDILTGKNVPDPATGMEEKEEEEDKGKSKGKDAPSKDERLQEVFRVQREMGSHIEWAKFAANNAVDLLSLVLSADPNKRSVASFSHTFRNEGLSQGVPFGSFGMSKENHQQHVRKPDEAQSLQEFEQRQELVSKGSRMEALDSATDEILKAAKKLEREVRREAKYWQEIVSISDKGWPIQRTRQNARNVPFAVPSNHFKARGLAPLRMDKDGSIVLDPALALKPKTLRVRISENGNIIGTSRLSIEDKINHVAIEKTIQLARDSLFEEELYHEMALESRQLLAYGVAYRDSVIHVKISGFNGQNTEKTLLIDCIPRDDSITSNQDHSSDWLAQKVAEGLRLLLAHEHSMRLYRRSQLPSPIIGSKQDKPSPSLLRTLLAIFYHLKNVETFYSYLETIVATLRGAGLGAELETTREISWAKLAENIGTSFKIGMSATDQLLDILSKPFEGQATLSLTSSHGAQREGMKISTRTVIGPPTFGTEHKLTLPSSLVADLGMSQQLKFSSVDELIKYLDWILSLHIAHRQLKNDFSSRAVVRGDEARITIRSKESKKGSNLDRDITIELQDGELKATVTAADPQEDAEDATHAHSWKGVGGEISLKEKIKSWVD